MYYSSWGGGIILYRSYALYQEEKTYNVLKGQIPEFVRNDVEVAYLIDGEKASTFPEKSSKYNVTIECTGATGEWDKDKWGLMITSATAEKIKCSISFETKNPTTTVTVHGAVQETITLSDGQTIETDATGIATAEVQIGETYTLTGSVSKYTSEEQIIEDETTDLYAMPKGALYWYGNECTDITGGWGNTYKIGYWSGNSVTMKQALLKDRYIDLSLVGVGGYTICAPNTINKVNLSKFTYLNFEIESVITGYMSVKTCNELNNTTNNQWGVVDAVNINLNAGETIVSNLELKNKNDLYIVLHAGVGWTSDPHSEFYIKRIWLE